jgi:hypothetical protein
MGDPFCSFAVKRMRRGQRRVNLSFRIPRARLVLLTCTGEQSLAGPEILKKRGNKHDFAVHTT